MQTRPSQLCEHGRPFLVPAIAGCEQLCVYSLASQSPSILEANVLRDLLLKSSTDSMKMEGQPKQLCRNKLQIEATDAFLLKHSRLVRRWTSHSACTGIDMSCITPRSDTRRRLQNFLLSVSSPPLQPGHASSKAAHAAPRSSCRRVRRQQATLTCLHKQNTACMLRLQAPNPQKTFAKMYMSHQSAGEAARYPCTPRMQGRSDHIEPQQGTLKEAVNCMRPLRAAAHIMPSLQARSVSTQSLASRDACQH